MGVFGLLSQEALVNAAAEGTKKEGGLRKQSNANRMGQNVGFDQEEKAVPCRKTLSKVFRGQ